MSETDLTTLRLRLEELTPQGRAALMPALHLAQSLFGYLPEQVAAEVGRTLGVPLAEVHGMIEFYDMFYPRQTGAGYCTPAPMLPAP